MQEVKKHPNAHMQYVNKLLSEGTVTDAEVRDVHNRVQTILQEEFDAAKDYRPSEDEWLSNVWEGFKSPAQLSRIRNTGASFSAPMSRPLGDRPSLGVSAASAAACVPHLCTTGWMPVN